MHGRRYMSNAVFMTLILMTTCGCSNAGGDRAPSTGGPAADTISLSDTTSPPDSREVEGSQEGGGGGSGGGDGEGGWWCEDASCPSYTHDMVVDGKLTTPGEYGSGPVPGKFGFFYLDVVDGDSFQFFNDWTLRKGAPICPAMYNLFQFSTGDGRTHWEVRVFGDGHAAILRDGAPFTDGEGGYFFGPSALESEPHTQFEFRVNGVDTGSLACMLHDPSAPPPLYDPSAGGAVPGCDDPDGALVREPTLVKAVLTTSGIKDIGPATGATPVTFDNPSPQPGDTVALLGAGFGKASGELEVAGHAVTPLSWAPERVTFQVPNDLIGEVIVRLIIGPTHYGALVLHLPVPGCNARPVGSACESACGPAHCSESGQCVLDQPCADSKVCTADSCDEVLGCQFVPSAGKTCNDDNPCTTGDECAGDGICRGDAVVCTSDLPCFTAVCESGECVEFPASGTACDDGVACTLGDLCYSGSCQGTPIAVSDGNDCTLDSCDPKVGPKHVPVSSGACYAQIAGCLGVGKCNQGECVGAGAPGGDDPCFAVTCSNGTWEKSAKQGAKCSDGDPDTQGEVCQADGSCQVPSP